MKEEVIGKIIELCGLDVDILKINSLNDFNIAILDASHMILGDKDGMTTIRKVDEDINTFEGIEYVYAVQIRHNVVVLKNKVSTSYFKKYIDLDSLTSDVFGCHIDVSFDISHLIDDIRNDNLAISDGITGVCVLNDGEYTKKEVDSVTEEDAIVGIGINGDFYDMRVLRKPTSVKEIKKHILDTVDRSARTLRVPQFTRGRGNYRCRTR